MLRPLQLSRRLLGQADARFKRSRPGSVIIMVVALLVLMALMGTAFLVTSRTDRVTARTFEYNVEIDMLVQSLENTAMTHIMALSNQQAVSDTVSPNRDPQRYTDYYTMGTPSLNTQGYMGNGSVSSPPSPPYVPANLTDESWLASRMPEKVGEISANAISATPNWPVAHGAIVSNSGGSTFYECLGDNMMTVPPASGWMHLTSNPSTNLMNGNYYNLGGQTSSNPYVWPALTMPLIYGAIFEDPRASVTAVAGLNNGVPFLNPNPACVHTMAAPMLYQWPSTTGVVAGQVQPALAYYSLINQRYEAAMAASASGDGYADSFYWRLPVNSIDGLTYYAAVRIIDNNSAINLNTANSCQADWDALGNLIDDPGYAPALFPSSIGLNEALPSSPVISGLNLTGTTLTMGGVIGSEMFNFNQYRFSNNGQSPVYPPVGVRKIGTANSSSGSPTDEYGARNDFSYITVGDALYELLGRRVANPVPSQVTPLTWQDSALLAYKFDLPNLNATRSWAETQMPTSMEIKGNNSTILTSPTNYNYVTSWAGTYQFNTLGTDLTRSQPSRRGWVTARNPVANVMPAHNINLGELFDLELPNDMTNPLTFNAGPTYKILQRMVGGDPAALSTSTTPPPYGANSWSYPYTSPPPASMYPLPSPLPSTFVDLNNMYLGVSSTITGGAVRNAEVPRVPLNTAPVMYFDPTYTSYAPGTNAYTAFHTPTPTLWLGFYNAMMDALTNYPINIADIGTGAGESPSNGGTDSSLGGSPYVPGWWTAGYPYGAGTNYHIHQIDAPVLTLPKPTALSPKISPPISEQNFRSCIRDTVTTPTNYILSQTNYMSVGQMMLLRSLLASLNCADLRDSDDDLTYTPSPTATISAANLPYAGQPTAPVQLAMCYNSTQYTPVDVCAYGYEKQPFIVEVYANNDNRTSFRNTSGQSGTNPVGYVGVELYNPYDVPIYMNNWQLAVLNKMTAIPKLIPVPYVKPTGYTGITYTLSPKSYVLLENIPPTGTTATAQDAQIEPFSQYYAIPTLSPTVTAATGAVPFKTLYVPGLDQVMYGGTGPSGGANVGGELMLLRPVSSSNTPAAGTYNASVPLTSMCPCDSFDFSGMNASTTVASFNSIHAVRMSPGYYGFSNPPQVMAAMWKFVYPGRWSATKFAPYRLESIQASSAYTTFSETQATWTRGPICFGPNGSAKCSYFNSYTVNGASVSNTNPLPGIQLNNTDFGGPRKLWANVGLTQQMFPFGGFARVADVLQVPFIGSYTILQHGTTNVIEMNSITMDASLADSLVSTDMFGNANATQTSEANFEQIGRFCPAMAMEMPTELTNAGLSWPAPAGSAFFPFERPVYDCNSPCGWASRIFDYFTAIQSPSDDYFPPVPYGAPATLYTKATALPTGNPLNRVNAAATPVASCYKLWDPAGTTYTAALYPPDATKNTNNITINSANGGNEDLGTIEGQININTASESVLALVPWVPWCEWRGNVYVGGTTSQVNVPSGCTTMNTQIAAAIVQYRSTYGPFKSLFDLNKVTIPIGLNASNIALSFAAIFGDPSQQTTPSYYNGAGNFTPFQFKNAPPTYPTTTPPGALSYGNDWLRDDFSTRTNSLTRVSNLLTTRSDTFTVYLLVQGWKNAGTSNAVPVVTRRSAFIIDRSGVDQFSQTTTPPPRYNISTN